MKVGIYSIYDRKVDAFGQLMLFPNDDLARRAIHATVLDPSSEYGRYAADFMLYRLGDYDGDTGEITVTGLGEKTKVCNFDDFKS